MFSKAELALDSWSEWKPRLTSRPEIVSTLEGGLTNQNYKLQTSNGDGVLRLANPESASLGINRQREFKIIQALQGHGITSEIWYSDPDTGVMISRYVEGDVYSANQLSVLQKKDVTKLITHYQSLQIDLPRFDYLIYLQDYRKKISARGTLSADLESEWQSFSLKLINWQNSGWEPVLCHHDLAGENLINSNGQWKLIDWEYAAMGHPAIDLLTLGEPPKNLDSQEENILLQLIQWLDRFWWLLNSY